MCNCDWSQHRTEHDTLANAFSGIDQHGRWEYLLDHVLAGTFTSIEPYAWPDFVAQHPLRSNDIQVEAAHAATLLRQVWRGATAWDVLDVETKLEILQPGSGAKAD